MFVKTNNNLTNPIEYDLIFNDLMRCVKHQLAFVIIRLMTDDDIKNYLTSLEVQNAK